ncbi:hypothetical protein Cgig2_030010 [Carnegiea gigantea]|uniref:Uncharacterized protein n=1 Tax=Carnegiea gigantea TaxID=171969 RepID=A0A9Q1QDS7_9CARY|nr:hypothetical protein Cgig2_030010 [Carnegiea gigantea]
MKVSRGLSRGRVGMVDDGRRQQVEWVIGKILEEVTYTHVWMEGDGASGGNGRVGRELVVYVLWVGELEEDGDEKLIYVGGSTKCILLKEGMAMEEVLRLVTGIRGSDLHEGKLWLKYDRQMLMAIEGDVDVRMILKENDDHGHFYAEEVHVDVTPLSTSVVSAASECPIVDGKKVAASLTLVRTDLYTDILTWEWSRLWCVRHDLHGCARTKCTGNVLQPRRRAALTR